jgi:glucose/arabinose dehydrogenase
VKRNTLIACGVALVMGLLAACHEDHVGLGEPDATVKGDGTVMDGSVLPDASATDGPRGADAAMHPDAALDGSPGDAVPGVDADLDGGMPDALPPTDSGPTFCELPGQDVPGMNLPSGFCSRVFATVPCPRVLRFAPNGDVFVASPATPTPGGAAPGMGAIVVLPDDNHDGVADGVTVFASGAPFADVHGLHFRTDTLFYSTSTAVHSVPYARGDRHITTSTPIQIADMSDPGISDRWTHTISEDIHGQLYVTRGQYDNNTCPSTNPRSGSVLAVGGAASAHGDVMITGMRNPMYLRCMPWGTCYAAELTGDSWDTIGGVEKLVVVQNGGDYGYPCCVARGMPNPNISPTPDCSMTALSAHDFPLHNTPFGFDWERGLWPAPYANSFFVALHGNFGGWIGEAVQWSPVDPNSHSPTGPTQDFATGWSLGGPIVGRPTDLMFAPDGRLFVTDDAGGVVFWIAPRSLLR